MNIMLQTSRCDSRKNDPIVCHENYANIVTKEEVL